MIATLGDTAMGAHQIAFNVWDVVYIPLISIGSAIATRMGHAIGAGDRQGISATISTGMLLTAIVALLSTVLLLSSPALIVRACTDDQAILGIALALIRLAALFIVLDAIQVVASFCLRAYKDTRYPFLIMCLAYWLISLPLGYWLGLVKAEDAASGAQAFWAAMIVGIGIAALLVSWRLIHTLRKPLPKIDPTEIEAF